MANAHGSLLGSGPPLVNELMCLCVKPRSPHVILRSPLTPDSTVEGLIRDSLASSNGEGPVILLIEPCLEHPRDQASSQRRWPVFEGPPEVEKED